MYMKLFTPYLSSWGEYCEKVTAVAWSWTAVQSLDTSWRCRRNWEVEPMLRLVLAPCPEREREKNPECSRLKESKTNIQA